MGIFILMFVCRSFVSLEFYALSARHRAAENGQMNSIESRAIEFCGRCSFLF